METWEKSRYISRIISGQIRFRINNQILYVRVPTKWQRFLAEEIFVEHLEEAQSVGAYSQEQLNVFLNKKEIWFPDNEDRLNILYKDVEKLKIGLFEKRLRLYEQKSIRIALQLAKSEVERLEILKHSYDHLTDVGMANAAKQRYLLGCSIFLEDNSPYWQDESGWSNPDPFLDKIMFRINKSRIYESEFREMSRTDPWRSIWNIQKHCTKPLFEGSAVDLTDEQKNLIVWSSIYESVREHPDNLEDSVINDDDMLDGWMIIKRKEKEKTHVNVNEVTNNEKIKNASEQFITVKSVEDAQRVMSLNDDVGIHTLQQRMNTIKQKGIVSEEEMPDTTLKLRQQKMDMFSDHIKKTKGK